MNAFSRGINIRSRRKWIDRAILAANTEKHQFGIVVELQAEPIPSNLFGMELLREEFVIHSGRPGNRKFLFIQLDVTADSQTRQGNVMRRAPRARGFLAYSVHAMNYRLLLRFQPQL